MPRIHTPHTPIGRITFLSYVSDPDIALDHINNLVTRVLQYQIFYPTPQNLDQALFEAQYDEFLDAELIDAPHHCERCGEDITDLCMNMATKTASGFYCGDCDLEDEPACGDCGGCCECLGDPPDCRWDTIAEREEELSS